MTKNYPTASEEYIKAVEKAKKKLRGLIAEKNCAPLMLRLAYLPHPLPLFIFLFTCKCLIGMDPTLIGLFVVVMIQMALSWNLRCKDKNRWAIWYHEVLGRAGTWR